MAEKILARLKPRDGKKHTLRSYTVFGIKFVADRGWYKIDHDVADYLRTVKQKSHDPDSNDAFDVCTESQAKALDESERKKALRRSVAEAEEAVGNVPMRVHNVRREGAAAAARVATAAKAEDDLTTTDLRKGTAVEEEPEEPWAEDMTGGTPEEGDEPEEVPEEPAEAESAPVRPKKKSAVLRKPAVLE